MLRRLFPRRALLRWLATNEGSEAPQPTVKPSGKIYASPSNPTGRRPMAGTMKQTIIDQQEARKGNKVLVYAGGTKYEHGMTDVDQRSLEYASEIGNLRDKLQNLMLEGRSKDGTVTVKYSGTGLVSHLKVREDQTDLSAVLNGIKQAINDGNDHLCQEAEAETKAFDAEWQSMFTSLTRKEALQPYFPSIKRSIQGERYEKAVRRQMEKYLGALAAKGEGVETQVEEAPNNKETEAAPAGAPQKTSPEGRKAQADTPLPESDGATSPAGSAKEPPPSP